MSQNQSVPTAAEGENIGNLSVKERLILSGIKEIEREGFHDFSLRHIAQLCGVSCAAPYKHFKDKQEFILEIIHYINQKWIAIQESIMSLYAGDRQRQLLEVCMGYFRFLVDNPHFRSVIVTIPKSADPEQLNARHELSASLKKLVKEYGEEMGISEKMTEMRSFIVRSLIYGAAMFIDNRQMADDDATATMVRAAIQRELSVSNGLEIQMC